jgi:hypothetical protein
MLLNNILSPQANINPDNIWIEQDEHGKLLAYIINQFESGTDYLDERSKNYWAPEILVKYNDLLYYGTDISKQRSNLKRHNTNPSTMNIVYSLGLILYFIVFGEDPFPEMRIQEFESPVFRRDSKYTKYIKLATHPDVTERINLIEWKELISAEQNTTGSIFSKIYKYMCKTT